MKSKWIENNKVCLISVLFFSCNYNLKQLFFLSAGDSLKSLEDDAPPKEGVGGGSETTEGGNNLKDNENGSVEKDTSVNSVGNTDTPTKSSKLSIFGSKDKKDKSDKNASDKDNNSKMPLGLGGKPKGASSDGFDGKSINFFIIIVIVFVKKSMWTSPIRM